MLKMNPYEISTNDPQMVKMQIFMILYENYFTHDLFYDNKFIMDLLTHTHKRSTKHLLKGFIKEYFKGLKDLI